MFLYVCEIVVTTERQGGRGAGVSCHVGVCVTSEREKSGKSPLATIQFAALCTHQLTSRHFWTTAR